MKNNLGIWSLYFGWADQSCIFIDRLNRKWKNSVIFITATIVTRLGDYFKFLATNCLTKVAQIFWSPFGLFLAMKLLCKGVWLLFWQFLGDLGQTIYSIIWSSWVYNLHDPVTSLVEPPSCKCLQQERKSVAEYLCIK